MHTRRPISQRLAVAMVPVTLALAGCTPATGTVIPAADEQPAEEPVVEEAPVPPSRDDTGWETCSDRSPGSYC